MRGARQEPRRPAVSGAVGARSGDGAAAQWALQAARGQVNRAADRGGEASDSRCTAKAVGVQPSDAHQRACGGWSA
jgi:hypothetical protein